MDEAEQVNKDQEEPMATAVGAEALSSEEESERAEGAARAEPDPAAFTTKWPEKMLPIPGSKLPPRQRITEESVAAEKQASDGPTQGYQDKVAAMTILTDSESDQGALSPGTAQAAEASAGKGAEHPDEKRAVSFAAEDPVEALEALLKARMVKPSDLQGIVEQLADKGLTEQEKASLVEKRLEEIEKKNLYKHSVNAKLADMPKVFAFEVENNIRTVLASLLKPVMENYRKANANVADLNSCYKEVAKSIEGVNRRLDQELSLAHRVEEANLRLDHFRKEWAAESERVGRKVSELQQLTRVHEDKLVRYNDERERLTQSRDQMRGDIREFEKLVQELAAMSKSQVTEVKEDYTEQIAKLGADVDQIMFDHRVAQDYIQAQKPRAAQLDAEFEMMKATLKAQQVSLFRLEHLEKVVVENERFLGYVLPLRIQETIHRNLVPLHEKDPEAGIGLLELAEERMRTLSESLEAVDKKLAGLKKDKGAGAVPSDEVHVPLATFEKTKYQVPPFAKLIAELRKAAAEVEVESAAQGRRSAASGSASASASEASVSVSPASPGAQSGERSPAESEPSALSGSDPQSSESDRQAPKQTRSKWPEPGPRRPNKQRSQSQEQAPRPQPHSSSAIGGTPAILGSLKQRLKLKHLKVSHAQLLRFSSRVGRRLLKNQTFLDKLADCLDGESGSDYSEEAEEPWGLDDGEADLVGYEDRYSEGRLESTESERSLEAISPSSTSKKAARTTTSPLQESDAEEQSGQSPSDSEQEPNRKAPQKRVQPQSRGTTAGRPSVAVPAQQPAKKAVKRVEFIDDDQADEEDPHTDHEQDDVDRQEPAPKAPAREQVDRKQPATTPARRPQKAEKTFREDAEAPSRRYEDTEAPKEQEDSEEVHPEASEPEPGSVTDKPAPGKGREPVKDDGPPTKKSRPDQQRKRAPADAKRSERRKAKEPPSDSPDSKEPVPANTSTTKKPEIALEAAVPDQEQNLVDDTAEKAQKSKQAVDQAKEPRKRRERREGEAASKNTRSRREPAPPDDAAEAEVEHNEDVEEVPKPEDKPSGRRGARRAAARKEHTDDDGKASRHKAARRSPEVGEESSIAPKDADAAPTERGGGRRERRDRRAAAPSGGSKESKASRSKGKRSAHEDAAGPVRGTPAEERQRHDKLKAESKPATNSSRSTSKKQSTKDAKNKDVPKVADADAQFYQIRVFMEEMQQKVAHLEKLNGVGRSRGPHQSAEKAPKRESSSVKKERQRQDRATVRERHSPKESKRSGSGDQSKGSDRESPTHKVPESRSSRRSRSEASSAEEGASIDFSKLSSEIRELKNNIKTINSKILDIEIKKGAGSSSGVTGTTDLFAQMAVRSNEMKKTFADQKEQFDLIKDQMKQELKRLLRQDFQTTKDLDQLLERLEQVQQRQEAIDHNQVLQDHTFAVVFKLLRMQYALMHQDEMDKQNIFLLGAKEQPSQMQQSVDLSMSTGASPRTLAQRKKSAERPGQGSMASDRRHNTSVDHQEAGAKLNTSSFMGTDLPKITGQSQNRTLLQFDKSCLSCGGQGQKAQQIPTLIKAFKMACLSYRPSQVVFDSRTYERNQLIEAQGYLLYLALKQLQHLDFNSADNTLLGGHPERVLAQDFINSSQEGHNFDELLQLANIMDSSNSSRIERNDRKGNHQHHMSTQQQSLAEKSMLVGDSVHNASMENSLFGGNSTELVPPSRGNQQISLSKSKEYTQLASQIPQIYGVRDGKPELAVNDNGQSGSRELQDILRQKKMVNKGVGQALRAKATAEKVRKAQEISKALQQKHAGSEQSQIHRYDQPPYAATSTQIKNQRNIINFNTINVMGMPLYGSQAAGSSSKHFGPTAPQGSSTGTDPSQSHRGMMTRGMARRSQTRGEGKNLGSTMYSMAGGSTAPPTSTMLKENKMGKTRLFSVDFGPSTGSTAKYKTGTSYPRAAPGTADGGPNMSGLHASLPKVSDPSRAAQVKSPGQVAAARQSFENFARNVPVGALSGSSEIGGRVGGWAVAPKTARTGVVRGTDHLTGTIIPRLTETKPHFQSGFSKEAELGGSTPQRAAFLRTRQGTAPAAFDFQD